MLYTSQFTDINGKLYQIDIVTGNSTAPWDGDEGKITLSGNPCVISSLSDGLFSAIKSRTCTIEMVSPEYHMDLYQPEARGAKVTVYYIDESIWPIVPEKIFVGWLTPCSYDQDFTYLDSIQLEAVDGISSCKDFRIQTTGVQRSFFDIITSIIKDAGYTSLWYPSSYRIENDSTSTATRVLDKLYICDSNFIDDDEEGTHWTEYEVLEEILKYMGWSLCPFGEDVYLIDYNTSSNTYMYRYTYNPSTNTFEMNGTTSVLQSKIDINLTNLAPGTSRISIDDIYNKIEISDNIYEIDEVSPDVFDDEFHISVTKEITAGPSQTQWTRTETTGALWWKNTTNTVTGYDFQTFCRLNPNSGWKHYFYRMEDLECLTNPSSDGTEYYYPSTNTSPYTNTIINKKINTHGALVQHYAHLKEQGANNIPATIDWTSVLTFFITNPAIGNGTGTFDLINKESLELPVLEYNMGESINWKPSSGTSWLTIQGDLFYQWNATKYGDKNKNTLYIVNDKAGKQMYFTAPVDKSVSIDENKYINIFRTLSADPSLYGTGFSMWKMKVQVGDKYWGGTGWVDYETTFYIKYNNNPDGENQEFVPGYSWMSPVNLKGDGEQVTYKDKVGVDGYCIPISSDDSSAPTFGKLKITVYTPTLIPEEIMGLFRQLYNNSNVNCSISWKDLPPVVYCKDFKIGYVYTDTSSWWDSSSTETNKNDKVYVGYIDTNYVQDFSTIELKINTSIPDKPISKSYVSTSNGLLSKLRHTRITGGLGESKIQEYNLIDNYLDHYSDRKIIYEANLHGLYKPYQRFEKTGVDAEESALDGVFMIDSYQYDLRNDNNRIKFIQF